MQKFNTQGIVLSRTNYGEAARIITFLTPGHGKVKAMAKGVRKPKSKLAGGVELFSVSDISILPGRGEISTLISSRLIKHYGQIVKDLDRTSAAYQTIKVLNKTTEDQAEASYFHLLNTALESLDDEAISHELVSLWFMAQLLRLAGHTPNLTSQKSGSKLIAGKKYDFNLDSMSFEPGKAYITDQIKFLRLLFSNNPPQTLQKVQNLDGLVKKAGSVIGPSASAHLRL